ncbi:MAG: nicotinate-nucleotide adenylyltransferase [Muribaculaceae bacterium]|nr:nicotinate-nucleotide adenylyltransferase [Muribaculaceae bacterium]MBQ6648189.1 nicotinate-nucleotide adenylyltransferase [Muribaculaceae bacterium]
MSKIGIFGGSFNPIHVGHALIARYIIENSTLDSLWLMVSPQNPLKANKAMASDYHRLRMTELVSRRIDNVTTSAFEFNMPKPSYTIDTLNALQEKFPGDEFYLVIGADNWSVFDQWKAGDEIIAKYHVLIYPRRGYDIEIPEQYRDRVQVVDAPLIEVSSTLIRQRLEKLLPVSFYVPEAVEKYIVKNKLYMNDGNR